MTSFNVMNWQRTPPYIKQNKQSSPYNIYKMPIENCKIQSQTLMRTKSRLNEITNTLVNPSNQNVHTVEACCQKKSTSKYSVTECKSSCCVFSILTSYKLPSQTNSKKLKKLTLFQIRAVESMFCSVCSKERSKQNEGVSLWQTGPVERNNSKRGPKHSNFNCRHNSDMHKSPQQSKEEDGFTYNKINYSKQQTILHFRIMKMQISFSNYITPPQRCNISNQAKSKRKQTSCTRITMKKKDSTHCLKQKTKSCQSWPRTWVYNVIRMVWNTAHAPSLIALFPHRRKLLMRTLFFFQIKNSFFWRRMKCSCLESFSFFFFFSFSTRKNSGFERKKLSSSKLKDTRKHIIYFIVLKIKKEQSLLEQLFHFLLLYYKIHSNQNTFRKNESSLSSFLFVEELHIERKGIFLFLQNKKTTD